MCFHQTTFVEMMESKREREKKKKSAFLLFFSHFLAFTAAVVVARNFLAKLDEFYTSRLCVGLFFSFVVVVVVVSFYNNNHFCHFYLSRRPRRVPAERP